MHDPKLDKIDWKILSALDGTFDSFSTIAKKLKVSRDFLYYRIKRMEEQGIIRNYISVIDYFKLGYSMAAFYIKFRRDDQKVRSEIINYLVNTKEVWWALDMSGYYDLGIGVMGKGIAEIREFELALYDNYREKILATKSRIFIDFVHFPKDYFKKRFSTKPSSSPRVPIAVLRNEPSVEVDELDLKILRLLSENARMNRTEIAKQLGISLSTVFKRIDSLKKRKILLSARPRINQNKLGIRWFKLDIYLESNRERKTILKFLYNHPNVIYHYDVLGGTDIELDVEASEQEFQELISTLQERFGPSINYLEKYGFPEEHKLNYI